MQIAFQQEDTLGKKISVVGLGVVFIVAGLNHFINPNFYMDMMPPYLPAHLMLIYLSGVAEIVGGVAVLVAKWRKWAGYFLILVTLAVFPANIYMAQNAIQFADVAPAWALYLRLPLQFALIFWIYMTAIHSGENQKGKR
ncbi:MAG: DoxX family membrane protein [Chloroflexota bacterium]